MRSNDRVFDWYWHLFRSYICVTALFVSRAPVAGLGPVVACTSSVNATDYDLVPLRFRYFSDAICQVARRTQDEDYEAAVRQLEQYFSWVRDDLPVEIQRKLLVKLQELRGASAGLNDSIAGTEVLRLRA